MTPRVAWFLCVMLSFATLARPASAQAPRTGRLLVTVVDPMGAALPGASLTIVGLEDATRRTAPAAGKTNERGVATVDGLPPGRYSVTAEFPSFEPGILKEIRVGAGDNRHTVTLPLRRFTESVTVGQDRQEAAADRSMTFGSALTREQIDALSDDPAEMQRQLQEMAGPGAIITVDSFEGAQLPSKAQIKSVRISRDQFAAEIHAVGFPRIDIVTQPGAGPFRGSIGANLQSSATDGANPLTGGRGPYAMRNFYSNISGTLIPNTLGFFLGLNGNNNYQTPLQCSVEDQERVCVDAPVRAPSTSLFPFVGIEYAVTRDHVMRVQFNPTRFRNSNQGLGDLNHVERAFSTAEDRYNFTVQEFGPVGRRSVLNSRFAFSRSISRSTSVVEAPTVVVLDAQTFGGAQRAGGTRTTALTLGGDLDYVRGRHSLRTGVLLEGSWFFSDAATNYLGTYTFESPEKFAAGQPRSFTRRIGDPRISYRNIQAAVYIQDDIRLRRNLTMTPGVRYEVQTIVKDYVNVAPRFGFTWAPFVSGRTTIRGSVGTFYDWISNVTYQQAQQIDGFHQREINIVNPGFPQQGDAEAAPVNRYLFSPDLRLPRLTRTSTGIQQTMGGKLLGSFTYAYVRGEDLLIGNNLNAPVNGVRANPSFANIIEAISAADSRQHQIDLNFSLILAGLGAPFPVTGAGPLIDWKRGFRVSANYTYMRQNNNTDGPFSTPARDRAFEWGPANGEIRHRAFAQVTTWFFRNATSVLAFTASSAPPLTIRTGFDDNGDLIFNDRPDGVGRNSARTRNTWNMNLNVSYGITFGRRTFNTGEVTLTGSQAGGFSATPVTRQVSRYRLSFNLGITNLLNRPNYGGYSGVMTSPFFLQPTTASGVRRMNLNINMNF